MSDQSLQQLLITNFGLLPSGYTGSQGAAGAQGVAGYTGSAGTSANSGGGSTAATVGYSLIFGG